MVAGEDESGPGDLHTAVTLMRMALSLLDRAGDTLAAARLQHAIDTAEGRGPLATGIDL